MVKYFKDLASSIDREKIIDGSGIIRNEEIFTPITLAVTIAGIYEHNNTRIQLKLNPLDVPDHFTTEFVVSLSPHISYCLEKLKERKESSAVIRVEMYLEGIVNHNESVSSFDTISLH